MKSLLVATLLLAAFPAFAKDKDPCKGIKSAKDAFGVESRGSVVYVGIGGYIAVVVRQVGPDKHLQMMFVQRGAMDTRVPVGTPGKVALADGTVLELVSGKESIPVANANENGVFTQWIVEFPLAADALAKLAASPLTAVSSSVGGQEMQFAVPEKKGEVLQAAAACIATH